MLSFLYVYSDHSILECYNLFSRVELSMRLFFVIIIGYRGGYDAREGYHEYRRGVQYHGGYHPLKFEYRGGYHDTCGDIMSTMGVFSTVGYSNNKRFPPRY